MNKNISIISVLFTCALLFITSCKSSKETAVSIALTEKSKVERLGLITSHSLQYNTFNSSLKFSIKPGQKSKNTTVDAQLRIIKDQAIQLSLRMPLLGTEAFRMVISPDSIIVVDRIHKLYVAESMERIKSLATFDFDFYSLQALFSEHLFIAGKKEVTPTDYASFSIKESEYNAYISNKDRQQIEYLFTSDYTNRILSTEMNSKKGETSMLWKYDDFRPASNNQLFPMKMKMDLNLPNDIVNMNLSFSKVEVNNDFSINFSIPNKYEQITLEHVVKMVKKML